MGQDHSRTCTGAPNPLVEELKAEKENVTKTLEEKHSSLKSTSDALAQERADHASLQETFRVYKDNTEAEHAALTETNEQQAARVAELEAALQALRDKSSAEIAGLSDEKRIFQERLSEALEDIANKETHIDSLTEELKQTQEKAAADIADRDGQIKELQEHFEESEIKRMEDERRHIDQISAKEEEHEDERNRLDQEFLNYRKKSELDLAQIASEKVELHSKVAALTEDLEKEKAKPKGFQMPAPSNGFNRKRDGRSRPDGPNLSLADAKDRDAPENTPGNPSYDGDSSDGESPYPAPPARGGNDNGSGNQSKNNNGEPVNNR